jgi:hypothetical protein
LSRKLSASPVYYLEYWRTVPFNFADFLVVFFLFAIPVGYAFGAVPALLAALALLRSIDRSLKQTLERWCMSHRLVSKPQIAIERVLDVEELPTAAQSKMLATSAKDPVRHRKVRVLCGSAVLLEADDWYLPSRVSPKVSALIEGTELPFEPLCRLPISGDGFCRPRSCGHSFRSCRSLGPRKV